MSQENILDYLRKTPHNTNVNVVKGMIGNSGSSLPEVTIEDNDMVLTVINGEWDKADIDLGYECSTGKVTVFDGSLTTQYSSEMDGNDVQFYTSEQLVTNSITVTFDGTEYELPRSENGYGERVNNEFVFTTYPCYVSDWDNKYCVLWTPEEGTYSLKIEQVSEIIDTNTCFEKAVKKFGLKNIADESSHGAIIENDLTNNTVSGEYSHAEGSYTTVSNDYSHAEGFHTTASGSSSHAEGGVTIASGYASHAEGSDTTASGYASHAEGSNTTSSGSNSHAEGSNTTASGSYSHAEGFHTTASGTSSHAEGEFTIANHESQHVFGEYNIADPSTALPGKKGTYIEIVGNGTNATKRSNARTLDWQGNETLAGSLTLGSTTLTEAQLQQLLALLN